MPQGSTVNGAQKVVTTDSSGDVLSSTSGAAHVNVQNTAVTVQSFATGGEANLAAGGTAALGDLSIYGIPLGSITFTAAGSTDTHTITWTAGNGKFMFEHTGSGATDAVTLSATTIAGDVINGPLVMITSAGYDAPVTSVAASASSVIYTLFLGV